MRVTGGDVVNLLKENVGVLIQRGCAVPITVRQAGCDTYA